MKSNIKVKSIAIMLILFVYMIPVTSCSDSDLKPMEEVVIEREISAIKEAEIGDLITFGHYVTTNDWIILDKDGSRALLLSKNVINKMPYNGDPITTNWENCDLRRWLNKDYIVEAFSDAERARIQLTKTELYVSDKIFLLTIDEVERYFPNENDRRADMSDGTSTWWWIHTEDTSYYAECIYVYEYYHFSRGLVSYGEIGVRPAIWVDFS